MRGGNVSVDTDFSSPDRVKFHTRHTAPRMCLYLPYTAFKVVPVRVFTVSFCSSIVIIICRFFRLAQRIPPVNQLNIAQSLTKKSVHLHSDHTVLVSCAYQCSRRIRVHGHAVHPLRRDSRVGAEVHALEMALELVYVFRSSKWLGIGVGCGIGRLYEAALIWCDM